MNYNGKEKINNFQNINSLNIIENNINSENEQIKSKCENLFNSYDILKLILCPNITKEKNKFMNMIIDIIKSQIEVFINILSLSDQNKIYEIINNNNKYLSKQITEIYNSNNTILSTNEINKIDNNKLNSVFNNNKNKNFHSLKSGSNCKIEDKNIKIKLEQINTKIQDSPIKIEIKDQNNNCLPIDLSTPISPYVFKNNKNKNKVFNIQTFNTNNNNKHKERPNSSLNDFKTYIRNKKNKYLDENKKRNIKYTNYNESLLFSHSLSNLYKKCRKNDCSPI